MADIRFKSKPQLVTLTGNEAIPCQAADGQDRYILTSQLTASIRNGMLALSQTPNSIYATGSTAGSSLMLGFSPGVVADTIARRDAAGALHAFCDQTSEMTALVNLGFFNDQLIAFQGYVEENFMQPTSEVSRVYGTDENGVQKLYTLAELGSGGAAVTPTDTPNQVYGTDDAGAQALYTISDAASNATIARRGAAGELKANTPADADGALTDVVNRGFIDTIRSDRMSYATVAAAGVHELSGNADVFIVNTSPGGGSINACTIKLPLPPSTGRSKRVTIRFACNIDTITWTADDPIGFLFPTAHIGDCLNLICDPGDIGWFVQARDLVTVTDSTDYWTPEDLATPPKVYFDADPALGLLTMATTGSRQMTAAASRFNAATYPMTGTGDVVIQRKDHRFENARTVVCAGGTPFIAVTGTAALGLSRNKPAFTMGGFFAYLVDTGSSGTQTPFIYVGTPTVDSLRLSIGRASNELNGLRYGSRRADGDTAQSYDAVGNMGITPFFAWMRVNWITGVVELWVNGQLVHTGATPSSGLNSSDTQAAAMGFGASSTSGSNSTPIAIRMGLFDDRWIPDAELRLIEGYHAHQLGMADILVAGHTYRSAPPIA